MLRTSSISGRPRYVFQHAHPIAALDDIGRLIDEGGTLLSCDSVEPLVQKLTYDSFCDEMAQTCVEINRS